MRSQKTIWMLLLLLTCITASNAQEPQWVDANMRAKIYNSASYYSGFASARLQKGESAEQVFERLRQTARIELVSSILVSIKKETRDELININQGVDNAQTRESYHSVTNTKAGANSLPGIVVETYMDTKTNTLYAFAYLPQKGLGAKLDRQLNTYIIKMELKLDDITQLANAGNKSEAKQKLAELAYIYDDIECLQQMLLAVDDSYTIADVHMDEYQALRARISTLTQDLSDGHAICITAKADLFGQNYPSLLNSIKGELSKVGCYFVDNEAVSDWSITIDAYVEEYNTTHYGDVNTYFVYAKAAIAMDKTATHKRVYEDELKEKGAHTLSNKEAAKIAYQSITKEISSIIIQQLK